MHSRRLFFNHIQTLADGVLKVVELQRMGSDINIGIVKKVVESFISAHGPDSEAWILPEHAESDPLFIYREYLHIPIITAAQEYYEATSKQFLRENCDSDYITWAEKMQKHAESYKLESFLHTITHDKLISTCKRILSAEGNIPDDAEYILRRIAQSAEGTGNDPDPSVTTCKLYLAMHESQKSLKIYKGPAKLLLSVCRSYTVWSVDFGDMLLSEIGHNTPHQWYRDVLRAFDESAACDLVQTLVQRGKVLEAFKSLFQSVPKRVLDQACENDDSEEGKITEAAWLKFSEMDEDISEVLECLQLVFSAPDEVQNILRLRDGAALSFLDLLDKRLCRRAGLLPSSFTLNDELSKDGEHAITAGGFADVFIGTYMGKKVALKELRVHGNENLKKSFCREAVFWRQFSHPNIVPFLGISDPKLFPLCMVSQWMENGSLLVYLRRYPRANRLNLLVGVAEGLLYLHQMGAVHGDVKSANILIDDAHRACLADFGLARITHDAQTASAITTSTAQHGSIRWMAPELLNPEQAGREDSRASAESDIYAVGMVILEAFTGKIPFHHHMRDATVVLDVTKGKRPDRPGSEATALGLSDLVWNLIELCWQTASSARPRIDFVLQCLKDAQSNFVPPEEDETQFGEDEHSDSEYSTDDEDDARRPFRRGFTKATPDS
ncbi:kinase-like protein [Rickenella mellea]|uniref:Kinase-like protein n=1 Tax=Rickenella mellea TaxID=50990 RepID=A0A4Y7Q4X8_9AGAM|nr:kinase-like protein [Rickenella mellea]